MTIGLSYEADKKEKNCMVMMVLSKKMGMSAVGWQWDVRGAGELRWMATKSSSLLPHPPTLSL